MCTFKCRLKAIIMCRLYRGRLGGTNQKDCTFLQPPANIDTLLWNEHF